MTKDLQKAVVAVFVLNILHGAEVSRTKFYESNPDFYPYTKYFETIPEAVYYVQHGWLYFLLFCVLCFVMGGRWFYVPLLYVGINAVSEIHHVVRGIVAMEYASGMITSALFIPVAILYWRALWNYTKHKKQKNTPITESAFVRL